MSFFSWNDAYAVGHPQIDQEHRTLFNIAEELHQAILSGKGSTVLSELLDRLVSYTQTHLRAEEGLMQAHRYPQQALHVDEHRKLSGTVLTLQEKAASGQMHITLDVMEFLRDWLEHHIEEMDRQVAAHLKRHRL